MEYRRKVLPDLASYASIDDALTGPEIVIPAGARWRFFRGIQEPPPDWADPGFDGAGWEEGESGFGYADDDDRTVLSDMLGNYTTLYIRKRFSVDDPARWRDLILSVRVDDGCVAYLNGKEIGRVRAGEPGVRIPFDGVATAVAAEPLASIDIPIDVRRLRQGENMLAIQGLNQAPESSDFSLIPELRGESLPDRHEALGIARALNVLEVSGSDRARALVRSLADESPWLPGGPDAEAVWKRLEGRRAAGPEWSSRTTDAAPSGGRRFLGLFGRERVGLTLEDLPAHAALRLSFDLVIIRSWDGNVVRNDAGVLVGPDLWMLEIDGGPSILRTTFSCGESHQANPDPYPGGDSPCDAVYRLSFIVPHASRSVRFVFSASGIEGIENESWGLDNVLVEALPRTIPLDPSRREAIWLDLASDDPVKASDAVRELVAAGEDGVAFLEERLAATKQDRARIRQEIAAIDSRRFDAFRAVAKDAEARLAYLEGRFLQRQGKHAEAVSRFEEALARDKTRPEPLLQIAESLLAMGKAADAERRLRDALSGDARPSDTLWDRWFTISVADLRRSPAELVESFPRLRGEGQDVRGQDIRWVLDQLRDPGVVRINAGGGEYRSSSGVIWSGDRLHSGGGLLASGLSRDPIAGTEDDPLYQTERWWGSPFAGYRIPLPAGRYEVTLHFAEVFYDEPGKRRFDIILEGEPALTGYEPPIDEADSRRFGRDVTDGWLDVEFIHRIDNPKLSAIEIRRE